MGAKSLPPTTSTAQDSGLLSLDHSYSKTSNPSEPQRIRGEPHDSMVQGYSTEETTLLSNSHVFSYASQPSTVINGSSNRKADLDDIELNLPATEMMEHYNTNSTEVLQDLSDSTGSQDLHLNPSTPQPSAMTGQTESRDPQRLYCSCPAAQSFTSASYYGTSNMPKLDSLSSSQPGDMSLDRCYCNFQLIDDQINDRSTSGVRLKPGSYLPPLSIDTSNYGVFNTSLQTLHFEGFSSPLSDISKNDSESSSVANLPDFYDIPSEQCGFPSDEECPDFAEQQQVEAMELDINTAADAPGELDLEALVDLDKYVTQAVLDSFDNSFNEAAISPPHSHLNINNELPHKTITLESDSTRPFTFEQGDTKKPSNEPATNQEWSQWSQYNVIHHGSPGTSPTHEAMFFRESYHPHHQDLPVSPPLTPDQPQHSDAGSACTPPCNTSDYRQVAGCRAAFSDDLKLLDLFSDDFGFSFLDEESLVSRMIISAISER